MKITITSDGCLFVELGRLTIGFQGVQTKCPLGIKDNDYPFGHTYLENESKCLSQIHPSLKNGNPTTI